jgi:hypothetical protein
MQLKGSPASAAMHLSDKDGIRMESVMALAMILILKAAVGSL